MIDNPKKLLNQWRPYPHKITEIKLDIKLDPVMTSVSSEMTVLPNFESTSESELTLYGEELGESKFAINNKPINHQRLTFFNDRVIINNIPKEEFILSINNVCKPRENTALSGIYESSSLLVSQCEAEGFRRITWFPDQPDVMSVFTVRLEANKLIYPTLLSNGNLLRKGETKNNAHFVVWHDPFPKPSYLFAIVAGDLACIEDNFITKDGRDVKLQLFAQATSIHKGKWALKCLKNAMKWDEEHYGRSYDLDLFMIVAIADSNFGAMENKGLNIFSERCLLADKSSATDEEFELIDAIVAHEYFHNWTGNRITCANWFNLTLKEGLTVFREQQYLCDSRNNTYQRIRDAKRLISRQFKEDAGPLSHPPRPDNYQAINNFYTATVYEKGAEIVRIIYNTIGKACFHKGMEIYFDKLDGTAATIEDFIQCMEEASHKQLSGIYAWYTQAGTPVITTKADFDPVNEQLTIEFTQENSSNTGNASKKQPVTIPLNLALIDPKCEKLFENWQFETSPINLANNNNSNDPQNTQNTQNNPNNINLVLEDSKTLVTLSNVKRKPIISINRNFHSPIILANDETINSLFIILKAENCLWQKRTAVNSIIAKIIQLKLSSDENTDNYTEKLAHELILSITQAENNPYIIVELLSFDSVAEIISQIPFLIDPALVAKIYDTLLVNLSSLLKSKLLEIWNQEYDYSFYGLAPNEIVFRKVRNQILKLLVISDYEQAMELVSNHWKLAANFTDKFGAIKAINQKQCELRTNIMRDYLDLYGNNSLLRNRWLALVAQSSNDENGNHEIDSLISNNEIKNYKPGKVISLLFTFAENNHSVFYDENNPRYDWYIKLINDIDKTNPQISSRLATSLEIVPKFTKVHQDKALNALKELSQNDISSDLREISDKLIAGFNSLN